MIVDGEIVYVLETNTIPGMTNTSLFPLAAKTAGIPFGKLLDKLIELCLERSKGKK
jgi:D-alanine-D-alanine ligase